MILRGYKMKLISLTCPSCGAKLDFDDSDKRERAFCQYCGQVILLQEEQVRIKGSIQVEGIDTNEELLKQGDFLLESDRYIEAQKKYAEYSIKVPEDYRGWLGLFKAKTRNFTVRDNNILFKRNIDDYYNHYTKTAPNDVLQANHEMFEDYFHPERVLMRKYEQDMKAIQENENRLKELKRKQKELKKKLGRGFF